MKINQNYSRLEESYLFSTIAQKVSAFQTDHPKTEIIRLGIGDVTLPLCSAVVQELHKAVEVLGHKDTFHGYGPEQGIRF